MTRLLGGKLVGLSTLPACDKRKIQVLKGLEFIKYQDPCAFCRKLAPPG